MQAVQWDLALALAPQAWEPEPDQKGPLLARRLAQVGQILVLREKKPPWPAFQMPAEGMSLQKEWLQHLPPPQKKMPACWNQTQQPEKHFQNFYLLTF